MKQNYLFLSALCLILTLSFQSIAATFNGSVILTNTVQQIECEVTINDVTGNVHFRLTGPSDRWFAFAFGTMNMGGYTLVANSNSINGPLVERDMLGVGAPGSEQATQNLTNILISTPAAGRIQIDADRLLTTGDPMDYVFPSSPVTVDMVYAVSQFPTLTFVYHGFGPDLRGPTTLVFSPLPVRMSSFDVGVEGDAGILTWETATEANSLGFEVERSSNATDWEKLTFIEGQGNSTSANQYRYKDESLMPGPNYYRIKMIDLDGSFEYSVIRAIDFQGPGINEDIRILPNLVTSTMKVQAGKSFDGSARIMIYNAAFVKVREEFWADSKVPFELDLSNLVSGPYFVYIRHLKWSSVHRIVKAR